MKPSAPLESLNPSDILATIFASKNGDPQSMAPTQLTADLTPFAGQTARLRIANAVHEEVFNAGVDAVSITSTPPSDSFTLGTLKRNRRTGSASLALTVPGPGTISVADALLSASAARAAAASAGKKPKALIKSVTITAGGAGAGAVALKPTGAGRKVLLHRHKLMEKVPVSFTPTGGAAATQTLTPVLSLRAKKTKGK